MRERRASDSTGKAHLDAFGARSSRLERDLEVEGRITMLPTHRGARGAAPATRPRGASSGSSVPPSSATSYLRRVFRPRQMDIEYSVWLMMQLCTSPKTAYRHATYHKQTKNQWARDDPAFVAVCCALQAAAACAFYAAFGNANLIRLISTVFWAVGVDFLAVGAVLATTAWTLANRKLKASSPSHAVEQRVEWLYAFDVHCNAFFPLFVLLYVVQFFLCPILLSRTFLGTLLSCLLYGTAMCYYFYITFLGYNALPFLQGTETFLLPLVAAVISTPFLVLAGFNPTQKVMGLYFR